ncbi:MAG: hypothetical protein ACYCWB_07480 [Thiobacillus sp.]|jgi:hypothetical protein|nr:hypothetical protein [Thiobacillus sp.]
MPALLGQAASNTRHVWLVALAALAGLERRHDIIGMLSAQFGMPYTLE